MKFYIRAIVACVTLSLALSSAGFAITLDTFVGDQSVVLANTPFGSSAIQTNNAIGGYREINAKLTSLPNGIFLAAVVGAGTLNHSQGALSTGSTQIVWDGNNNTANLNPAGLGGIDFTEDGGTALKIVVKSFDFPSSQPISLQFYVYDSSDLSGNKFSRTTLTLNQAMVNTTFELPFNNFAPIGANGGVNFHQVGAVVMVVDGVNPAVDLLLGLIGTNGHCTLVPLPGGVIVDQCGVCGGDSSSCKDCAGIPNGPSLPGTTCKANNPGYCGDGTYNQACQCIQTQLPDVCGVCFGDNTSCFKCDQTDQSMVHFLLDGAAKAQERIIDHALKVLGRLAKDKNTAKYIAKAKAQAHVLQIRNWTLSWQLPKFNVQCGTTPLCVKVSNMDKVNEYRQHNIELRNLNHQVNAKILKLTKKKTIVHDVKANVKAMDDKFSYALDLTYQVPEDQSVCSVPIK